MEEKQRQQEVSRVFQWFAQNPSTVEDIRSEDGIVDMETALGVLEKLREDKMEYMIPIFLANTNNDRVMNRVIKRFTAELLVKAFEADGMDMTIARLIDIAKEEMQ